MLGGEAVIEYDAVMGFDGAGKPYRSGPSWRGAILVIVGTVVALMLAWGALFIVFGD